ncbi:MAG: O-antigen ligase family protein [Phenylobacterium sp.]
MTPEGGADARPDRVAIWCGWLLVGLAPLVPLAGWLTPLSFSVLVALVGLLGLPAFRIRDEDRPAAVILFAALIWAAVSTTWSPYHPSKLGNSTVLKLAFQLPLYWSAVCVARRADPRLARLALDILAWGCAAFGAVLLVEAATAGALYKTLHVVYEPIRADLAESNLGHSTFVLGLLWPVAVVSAEPRARPWLALAMAAGVGAAALAFGSDAPVIGLVLAPLVALAAIRWPKGAPRVLGGVAAVLFLVMPVIVWAVRASGDYDALEHNLPLSWSLRMGYWSHAIDWIAQSPLRGWGLEASRMFGPGIKLHPHNGELQAWMELGVAGAVTAAAFWAVSFARLSRTSASLPAAAVAASMAVYVLFGSLNFGLWQEWWLAMGALVAMLAVLNARLAERSRSAACPSTATAFVE